MRKLVFNILKWLIAIGVVVFIVLAAFGMFVVKPRIDFKSSVPHDDLLAKSKGYLHDVAPEAQFESDTCGMHTLRVIYKVYGLDPDEENLRVRLGVDVPANPLDKKSTGTLQPDMFRVFNQDGFGYQTLPINQSSAITRLTSHLREGDMAAVLISRRENGNMHWVVAKEMKGEKVVILDSLFDEPYLEDPAKFFPEAVLSCILIKPGKGFGEDYSIKYGCEDILNTAIRYLEVKKYRKRNKK